MHRFYLPPQFIQGKNLHLRESDAHHAARVLRLQPGDVVYVLDGAGTEYRCAIERVGKRDVLLEVEEKNRTPDRPFRVTLFQAIPKARLMDDIIQKATELGVAKIVPLLSDRVATQLQAKEAESKAEKYRTVAIEAIKQSGNPWLPEVAAPQSLKQVLATGLKLDLHIAGSLHSGAVHPHIPFSDYRKTHSKNPFTVAAWVGPEGDFTPAEMDAICASGARPVTLGSLVLRCETAAIFLLSVINHESGIV